MTAREVFTRAARMFEGEVVLMGGLDCSDLVARCGCIAGLPDRRATYTAQRYADENPTPCPINSSPAPGDLLFYGPSWTRVQHIAIALDGGWIVSADGASWSVKTLAAAVAQPECRVRIHAHQWRGDFLGARVNHELDG